MRNKNKKHFFIFRLIPLPLVLMLAVFLFQCAFAEEDSGYESIVVSEIMYDPQGNNDNNSDWIELYNPTDKLISLKKDSFGFKEKEGSNVSCHKLVNDINIEAQKFLIIVENEDKFKNNPAYKNISDDILVDSSFDMPSSGGKLSLSNDRCKTYFIDFIYENTWGGKDNGKSLEKKDIGFSEYTADNWQESYIEGGTPGKENSKKEDCEEEEEEEGEGEGNKEKETNTESEYKDKVKINEIYPGPDTKLGEEEFVEIINLSDEDINFTDWAIKDEKNKKGKISQLIEKEKFCVFSGSFSLNNDTNGDTVFLYDQKEKLVDSKKYESAKLKFSFSFDGSAWRWTSQVTPGANNLFDKILSGKIKKDDQIYAGIFANFSVSADEDAKKFTWDFGDGHKSYLKKTRHKYKKAGKYPASLKISGNGETRFYDFDVKVEKFEAPKIRIKSLSPNPKGSDTQNEYLVIENKSKKKVNLKNWSVATGWDKLYNHPIREKFEIKAGKTKKLTREICAFTLANSKTKIELRDPSGKVVQKFAYDRSQNKIEEDELYSKESGKNWEWLTPKNEADTKKSDSETSPSSELDAPAASSIPPILDISPELIGKSSKDPAWQAKQFFQIKLAVSTKNASPAKKIIATHPRVLGARSVRAEQNHYLFTTAVQKKHWFFFWMETIWTKINLSLNLILIDLTEN